MKRNRLLVIGVLAILVFACAFGGTTEALGMLGPVSAGAASTVTFTVNQGESDAQVQAALQSAGLIKNSMSFKLLLKVRYHDAGFQAGTYQLSPGMSLDQILQTLLSGAQVQQVSILIAPGQRIAQYPAIFSGKLPNFDAKAFMQIATTGKYADGTTVNSKYWYVEPKQSNTVAALEGYLLPDTYDFEQTDTADQVINRLLDALGEQLCPGPSGNPTAYLGDQTQCKAHAATINGKSVFSLLEKNYFTTNDALALYRALTIASITMREISHSQPDAAKVTNLYYNRWLESLGKLNQPYDAGQGQNDVVDFLGADPTAMYARDTDTPPSGEKYWQPLQNAANQTDTGNLYNTNVATHKGLPPGPISGPEWQWLEYAINPATYSDPNAATSYFFFFTSCTNGTEHVYYANTLTQTNQQQAQYGLKTC